MENNGNCEEEKEIKNNSSNEENNISPNQKLDLNLKTEAEKDIKNEDENFQNNEYDDSLSYSTFYRSSQSSFNKNSKDIDSSIKRKFSSNISISQSDTNQELNGYSDRINFSQKRINRIQPINLFGKESNNSLVNYFKETENYIKYLYSDKNDFQKSKNYMEKEKYYKNNDDYCDHYDYIKYKSTDLSENKKNLLKEDNSNNNSFISLNKNILNNNDEKPLNDLNKINNKNNEENKKNINNININNNCYINKIYINPNINCNNLNGSKYDISMCYLGYYSVDCKS